MTSFAAAAELLQPLLLAFFLTFCRVGAAFFAFPAFTGHLPLQSRVGIGLAVSLPVSVAAGSPAIGVGAAEAVSAIMANVTVGLWLGLSGRLLLAAFHAGGQLIGQATGLYNPFPSSGFAFEGSTVVSAMMVTAGTALVFASDMHVHFIVAVAGSFQAVAIDGAPDPAVLNAGIVSVVSTAFRLAIQFAAPFLVLGLVFNLALGVANRMMPALPVYFVFSPVMIGLGLFLLVLTFGAMAAAFSGEMSRLIEGL